QRTVGTRPRPREFRQGGRGGFEAAKDRRHAGLYVRDAARLAADQIRARNAGPTAGLRCVLGRLRENVQGVRFTTETQRTQRKSASRRKPGSTSQTLLRRTGGSRLS